jgi:ubiquinone/menaquinone biosynthesis C-methylase UbiE
MKRGFGTNFHSVYKDSPKIYHTFSSAEIFSLDLLSRLKELFIGDVMLDVACGTCHKANMLSEYFKKVYCLDVSKSLLDLGRQEYEKNEKLNFILSSADNIPLLEKSVNTIFVSWGSFPLAKTIKEMKRVLAPKGVILRIGASGQDDFTRLFPKFDIKRIKRIQKQFEKEGFQKEEYDVNIVFDNIDIARGVLSEILHINKKDIKSKVLKHRIVLYNYKNL